MALNKLVKLVVLLRKVLLSRSEINFKDMGTELATRAKRINLNLIGEKTVEAVNT